MYMIDNRFHSQLKRVKTGARALRGVLVLIAGVWAILAAMPAHAQVVELDLPAIQTDARYGFGGHTSEGMDYLGIPVYRRWGEEGNADSLVALARGADSYFVVGKIDMAGYSRLNRDADWMETGPRCRRSAQDDTLVPCVEVPQAGIPNHEDWEQISAWAAEYPGRIWEIANEPDWNPYFVPEHYAVWYHLYAQRIRAADPTARIMIGGLLMCCGEGVYEHFVARRADWDAQIANANTRHAWTTRFWNAYRDRYGDYPHVDVWNIHPYAQSVGAAPFDAQVKADATIARTREFLNFLTTLPAPAGSPPESDKPVYITEVGILGPEGSIVRGTPCETRGCLTQSEQEAEERYAIAYMNRLLDWLETEPRIARWYWFHWDWNPSRPMDHIGNLNTFRNAQLTYFEGVDGLNPPAIAYAQRAGSPLLFNRGFETHYADGTPYAWGFWAGGPGTDYGYGVDKETAFTGAGSLRIHVGAQAGEFGHLASARQPIYSAHYNGRLARVEASCRTTDEGRARLKVNVTDSQGVRNTAWLPGVGPAVACPTWQRIATEWFVLPDDALNLEVELVALGANQDVWFDDVALVLAGDVDASLEVNARDLAQLHGENRQGENRQGENGAGEDVGLDAAGSYVHDLLLWVAARMQP